MCRHSGSSSQRERKKICTPLSQRLHTYLPESSLAQLPDMSGLLSSTCRGAGECLLTQHVAEYCVLEYISSCSTLLISLLTDSNQLDTAHLVCNELEYTVLVSVCMSMSERALLC
jgi:hypothetical protein